MELRETFYEVRSDVENCDCFAHISCTVNILEAKRLLREEKELGRDAIIIKVVVYEEVLEEYV
tara:strand:- start:1520 stop:1708 length:189 start_codon:yes stop_codon:yes gene_type:complete